MTDRPEPLTPAGCDMGGNDWFPFYFRRLRTSKWWRRASDLARARNIFLWGEAYAAVPAGSLADDDDELAEAAGFGFDVDSFLAHKAEIMAPWVLCSDARWYHPTVSEMALDAWERQSEQRKKAAERKAEQRAKTREKGPKSSDVPIIPAPVPGDNCENTWDIGTQALQTGQDNLEANASMSPKSDEGRKDLSYPTEFEDAWRAYPHVKGRSSKKKSFGTWRRMSLGRRNLLPSAIARYAREGREPKADCGAPAMERWLDKELYLDWMASEPQAPAPAIFAGPPALRAWFVTATSEGFAASYVDPATWDPETRTLIARNRVAADKIAHDCADVLRRANAKVSVKPDERSAA